MVVVTVKLVVGSGVEKAAWGFSSYDFIYSMGAAVVSRRNENRRAGE